MEELLLKYLVTLPMDDLKYINNGDDVCNSLNDDAVEDIKDVLFSMVSNAVNYSSVLERLEEYKNKQEEEIVTECEPESESDSEED